MSDVTKILHTILYGIYEKIDLNQTMYIYKVWLSINDHGFASY